MDQLCVTSVFDVISNFLNLLNLAGAAGDEKQFVGLRQAAPPAKT